MHDMLKKTLGRGAEDQKGLTLIELLVVVGIIVTLAAVIVPLVIQFSGRGEAGAASAEWDAIQSASDTMMPEQTLTTVTASSESAAFILDSTNFGSGNTLSVYVRDATTTYCYTWATTGRVLTQVAVASGGACP